MTELTPRQQVMLDLGLDRVLAHKTLFAHRHAQPDPPFKEAMIRRWHSFAPEDQYVCDLAFRGSAKSTTAEEALVIMVIYRDFKLGVIFGETKDMACQRLTAIRREFERNEVILRIWGDMRGVLWSEDRLEFANGVTLMAKGRLEAIRGTKEQVERPDLAYFDDIEDKQSVRTEEQREKIQSWFWADALPAMADPRVRRVRISANALDEKCLAIRLKHPDSGFKVYPVPIKYRDDTGMWRSSWPERYSLMEIDLDRRRALSQGRVADWDAEYMLEPTNPATRPFKSQQLIVEPKVRTWQAVFAMFDPARTVQVKSATTGWAVWSWDIDKLTIWEADGDRLLPDQIINKMFDINDTYHPVWLGFEEDGLNEWALQPLRTAMVTRGAIPLKPVRAPRSKLDFIKALQPFFESRNVVLAKPMPNLAGQLQSFPTGDIDIPNALAYALRLRPGAPMYDDFKGSIHVDPEIEAAQGRPLWLCLNATRVLCTALVVQIVDGAIRILGDVVREGAPDDVVADVITTARLDFGRDLQLTGGPLHFDQWNNVGLRQAASRVQRDFRPGLQPDRGKPLVREMLRSTRRGAPALLVHDRAVWTMNAFAGGYCRALGKSASLLDHAEEGPYRTLMEGLESFVGLLELGSTVDEDDDRFNAVTAGGRPYRSMLNGAR